MKFHFLLRWYDKALELSRHPRATFYLAVLSFVDASIFPVSPNFMILPMAFAKPNKAFYYALIAILGSFLGGMVGYAIGYFSYEVIVEPFIHWMGYVKQYERAIDWFQEWGYWAIIVGCFLPFFPYKIFTIGAGVMQLHFLGFLVVSLIGRSCRFLLIAIIIRFGGPKVEPALRRALMRLGPGTP